MSTLLTIAHCLIATTPCPSRIETDVGILPISVDFKQLVRRHSCAPAQALFPNFSIACDLTHSPADLNPSTFEAAVQTARSHDSSPRRRSSPDRDPKPRRPAGTAAHPISPHTVWCAGQASRANAV